MFEAGEFDVATLYFSEFKSVIAQKPTALQLIPAKLPEAKAARRDRADAVYEYEPDEDEILGYLLPRNISAQIFRGAARERRLRAGRADERHGQRHPQRRRHDQQADAEATTASARRRSPRS